MYFVIRKTKYKGEITIKNYNKINNQDMLDCSIDLSFLDIEFSAKPLIIGGFAMEYYGIRNRGNDIDFIIPNIDYISLAQKYPHCRKDKWGDLYVSFNKYELLRSIFRFDYNFYAEGSIEYKNYRVISIEKLFFMKALAYNNQPEIQKHTQDYMLMWEYLFKEFQNKEYVLNADKHIDDYLNLPDGIVCNGKYSII